MKPFAFIQRRGDPRDGVERVLRLIVKHGYDPKDFRIDEFDYLPSWLEDSFSTGFAEGAARCNEGIIVTGARLIREK